MEEGTDRPDPAQYRSSIDIAGGATPAPTQPGQRPVPEDRVVRELIEASRLEREHEDAAAPVESVPVRGPRYRMDSLLQMMVQVHASDLHVKVGSPPGMRVDGRLEPMEDDPLSAEDTRRLVLDVLTDQQFERFEMEGDLDVSYVLGDGERFRVNVLQQRGSMGVVVRHVPRRIPTPEELGLPQVCIDFANKRAGLVLVTGPTGSGKSTTLAALLNHLNNGRHGHIVTMEDPIEFVHTDQRCYVTQREIGSDARSFPAALRRCLRQDPDVIMVGEMRDLETISLAVTAAETGHLVFATLHTTGAIQTINRIVDVFPPNQQEQIRMQLADTLQGVISQQLLPRDSRRGRVAALEVLVCTGAVRALIRESKSPQILNLMQTGIKDGMQTLERDLNRLVAKGDIDVMTALARANQPKQIQIPDDNSQRSRIQIPQPRQLGGSGTSSRRDAASTTPSRPKTPPRPSKPVSGEPAGAPPGPKPPRKHRRG